MNHEFIVVRSDSVTFLLLSFIPIFLSMSSSSSYSRGCFFFQRKEGKFCGWNHSIEGKEKGREERKRKRSKRETDLKSWYLSPTSSSTTCYINSQTCSIILPSLLIPILFLLPTLFTLFAFSLRVFFQKIGKMKENEPGCISFKVTIDSLVKQSQLIGMKLQSLRGIENWIMSKLVRVLHFLSFWEWKNWISSRKNFESPWY